MQSKYLQWNDTGRNILTGPEGSKPWQTPITGFINLFPAHSKGNALERWRLLLINSLRLQVTTTLFECDLVLRTFVCFINLVSRQHYQEYYSRRFAKDPEAQTSLDASSLSLYTIPFTVLEKRVARWVVIGKRTTSSPSSFPFFHILTYPAVYVFRTACCHLACTSSATRSGFWLYL
jgi:hypothetical protein